MQILSSYSIFFRLRSHARSHLRRAPQPVYLITVTTSAGHSCSLLRACLQHASLKTAECCFFLVVFLRLKCSQMMFESRAATF